MLLYDVSGAGGLHSLNNNVLSKIFYIRYLLATLGVSLQKLTVNNFS